MKMLTIKEAAAEMECSVTYARRILRQPDEIRQMDNNRPQYLYSGDRVMEAKEGMTGRKAERDAEKGLRSCRTCKNKMQPSVLVTGRCPECRATAWIINFLCHGDCFRNNPDILMGYSLISAWRRALAVVSRRNAAFATLTHFNPKP